jgi:hypothetical protein
MKKPNRISKLLLTATGNRCRRSCFRMVDTGRAESHRVGKCLDMAVRDLVMSASAYSLRGGPLPYKRFGIRDHLERFGICQLDTGFDLVPQIDHR